MSEENTEQEKPKAGKSLKEKILAVIITIFALYFLFGIPAYIFYLQYSKM